jgi:hypothetical protein
VIDTETLHVLARHTAPPEDYDEASVLEYLRRAGMSTEEKVMENLAKSASSLERDA